MIRSERQYKVTQTERDRLATHLHTPGAPHLADTPAWVVKASNDAVSAQLFELDELLAEYQALKLGTRPATTTVKELTSLPRALIKARIASGLTQKQLADRLGLREQQVQRYEADDYAGANLARLHAVMEALDVDLEATLFVSSDSSAHTQLNKSLRKLGLTNKTLARRFFSTTDSATPTSNWRDAATRAARIFDTGVDELLTGNVPELANAGHFKATTTANRDRLNAYARYAEYLARALRQATLSPYRELPDVSTLRALLSATDLAEQPLETLLTVCWDHGVPVLPLADDSAFNGACWTFEDGPVIALKNPMHSPERWAFLLAHEMDHARHPDERAVLEQGLDVPEWREQPAERRADKFAADLLLGDRAEAMVKVAVSEANHDTAQLKRVLPLVAEAGGVATGILADHLAYRLTQSGINWWSTARSLHTLDDDAWRIARSVLYDRVDLTNLDSVDRQILIDGIAP